MKKVEFLFAGIVLGGLIAAVSLMPSKHKDESLIPNNKYGAFLAAQHAIYVNDFASASRFSGGVPDIDIATVNNLRMLSEFFDGRLPANVKDFAREKTLPARLIYDAYLASENKWDEIRSRHENDSSALMAPLKIWSSVAANYKTKTIKYIDGLETSPAWKSFIRGQIYAEQGDIESARKEFKNVPLDFMNINDYLYVLSFYTHNNLSDDAERLRSDFTATPGGMYMIDYTDVPAWSQYSGIKNQLAFSLLQTVSHTRVMMFSDLSLVLLKFAQVISGQSNADAIQYYIGQYLYNTHGDYKNAFNAIDKKSPFYPFVAVRVATDTGDIKELQLRSHPLFVPAVQTVLSHHIQHGNKRAALKIVNRALKNKRLSEQGRAFFTKMRANVYYIFGDYKRAQRDIHDAAIGYDGDIILLQAKIWAAQNREIETAYDYAMGLIHANPADVYAWDALGVVIYVREGVDAALDTIERVAQVSNNCSSLFEHLGDMYTEIGEIDLARESYNRAIDLSDDGLVVVPKISKKLRKLK